MTTPTEEYRLISLTRGQVAVVGGFRVQIRVKGKRISLGDVKTVEEGRILYAEAARRYHGDFAFPS